MGPALIAMAPVMSAIATGATIVGSVVRGVGQARAGRAAKEAADYEAGQLDAMSGEELAAGQREYLETTRQKKLLQSRAVAAAAGGASDPSVVDNIADIEREGEYRAMLGLYGGIQRAKGLRAQAEGTRRSGQAALRGGRLAAAGTIVGGVASAFSDAGSFYVNYGMRDQPPPSTIINNYMYG